MRVVLERLDKLIEDFLVRPKGYVVSEVAIVDEFPKFGLNVSACELLDSLSNI